MAGEPTITLIGRLGADPTINFTQTGRGVTSFSVAVTSKLKTDDGWIDKDTLWFRVSLWHNAEAAVDELRKGDLVCISGKLTESKYMKDGVERTSLQIDTDHVGVVPTKKTHGDTEAPF